MDPELSLALSIIHMGAFLGSMNMRHVVDLCLEINATSVTMLHV